MRWAIVSEAAANVWLGSCELNSRYWWARCEVLTEVEIYIVVQSDRRVPTVCVSVEAVFSSEASESQQTAHAGYEIILMDIWTELCPLSAELLTC